MKKLLAGLFMCLLASTALGGGPDIELEKAHIDDVIIYGQSQGIVLKITGAAKLFVVEEDGDDFKPGKARFVTILLKSCEVRFFGRMFSLAKYEGVFGWEEQYLKLKGTNQFVQMFGVSVVIEGGCITHVVAHEIGAWAGWEKPKEAEDPDQEKVTLPTPPSSRRTP